MRLLHVALIELAPVQHRRGLEPLARSTHGDQHAVLAIPLVLHALVGELVAERRARLALGELHLLRRAVLGRCDDPEQQHGDAHVAEIRHAVSPAGAEPARGHDRVGGEREHAGKHETGWEHVAHAERHRPERDERGDHDGRHGGTHERRGLVLAPAHQRRHAEQQGEAHRQRSVDQVVVAGLHVGGRPEQPGDERRAHAHGGERAHQQQHELPEPQQRFA